MTIDGNANYTVGDIAAGKDPLIIAVNPKADIYVINTCDGSVSSSLPHKCG